MTRICVGWICVDAGNNDADVVNNGFVVDIHPWSNADTLALDLVEEGNDARTPEDETRLGDVLHKDDESNDVEEYDGNDFINDVDTSILEFSMSCDANEEGTILIRLMAPVCSMVTF